MLKPPHQWSQAKSLLRCITRSPESPDVWVAGEKIHSQPSEFRASSVSWPFPSHPAAGACDDRRHMPPAALCGAEVPGLKMGCGLPP